MTGAFTGTGAVINTFFAVVSLARSEYLNRISAGTLGGAHAMARILDYIVIHRPVIDIGHLEQSEFLEFHVDANAVTDSDSIPALSFQARPRSSVVPGPSPDLGAVVDLEVIVNGLPTGVVHITLSTVRAIWRTFSEPALNAGSSANFVQFRSENGMVRISDVVLWYQRDVEI